MQLKAASPSEIRVLIVDDHPIVREALTRLLVGEPDMKVVGEAGSASQALQFIREQKPNMVLIDISLGGTNGIELIKQIKSLDGNALMLVVSSYDDKMYAERALRAGAMGYVNKQEMGKTIIGAIRQVRQGQIYLGQAMANQMLRMAVSGTENISKASVETLSDRELEVFEMIGRGVTTSQIAEKLHLSAKTVETHRENIKAKLRLGNANELVRYAVQWSLEKT